MTVHFSMQALKQRRAARETGFTLVEIGVALVALGLLLITALAWWRSANEQRVAAVQLDVQLQARQALLGFAQANYRLPCPAADDGGAESCGSAISLRQVGWLPWKTLQIPRPEAGKLRYGVYRAPSQIVEGVELVELDQDLAVSKDRMKVLRIPDLTTPPQNHTKAPNPNLPKEPQARAEALGNSNLPDFCRALSVAATTATSETSPKKLAVKVGATGNSRPVAFVLAAPGLLDADGQGGLFDGANQWATDNLPLFEAANRERSDSYDDKVIAAGFHELFDELQCGAALPSIQHAHFNTALAARVMERAFYDYRDQLYVLIRLAESQVASVAGAIASTLAGDLLAPGQVFEAAGNTSFSVGARVFETVLAGIGAGLAVVASGSVVGSTVVAAENLVTAKANFAEFAGHTTAASELATSISANAIAADAAGY